jgi:glutamate-1-semialdehyde aminotransferase
MNNTIAAVILEPIAGNMLFNNACIFADVARGDERQELC